MDKFFQNIKSTYKAAFVGTFVIGFLCYFYLLTHHFLTYDSLWNLYSDQNMISSGRQFLTYACSVGSYYDLPAINGLLSIVYLAVSAVIMVDIFKIQNKVTAVLMGGFLVTFPSIISTFAYSFTVDGYMLAVLLTTLAFWITDRYKYGFTVGVVLNGVAIGIYQAYFAYLIVLCILKLLLDLLEEENLKKIYRSIGRYLIMGIGGYVFYVISLKLMLLWQHAETSGYQGTDKVLGFSLSQLPQGLKAAFDSFYYFARWGNVLTTTTVMKLCYVVLFLCGAVMYGYFFIKNKRYKKCVRIILAGVLVLGLPFGLNVITILAPEAYFHLLMRYAWVLFFVWFLVLAERIVVTDSENKRKVKCVIPVFLCSAVMIFQFAVMANIVAFNMEERYEKTYALCLRVVDRLEQMEGYETGMEVAILGGFPDSEYYPATGITGKDLSGYFGVEGEYAVNSTHKIAEFCAHYLNVTLQTIPPEREVELTGTEEFQQMEKFPHKECIKQIDGVWVIKFNG